jgi:hypothetical protein
MSTAEWIGAIFALATLSAPFLVLLFNINAKLAVLVDWRKSHDPEHDKIDIKLEEHTNKLAEHSEKIAVFESTD